MSMFYGHACSHKIAFAATVTELLLQLLQMLLLWLLQLLVQ